MNNGNMNNDNIEIKHEIIRTKVIRNKIWSLRTASERQIYWILYKIIFNLWRMKSAYFPYSWKKLGTYYPLKSQVIRPLASSQAQSVSSTSFFLTMDLLQSFSAHLPSPEHVFTVDHFHPWIIIGWRHFCEILMDIGVVLRLAAVLLGIPYTPKMRKVKPRKKTQRIAFPPFIRRIGGPGVLMQTLSLILLPFVLILGSQQKILVKIETLTLANIGLSLSKSDKIISAQNSIQALWRANSLDSEVLVQPAISLEQHVEHRDSSSEMLNIELKRWEERSLLGIEPQVSNNPITIPLLLVKSEQAIRKLPQHIILVTIKLITRVKILLIFQIETRFGQEKVQTLELYANKLLVYANNLLQPSKEKFLYLGKTLERIKELLFYVNDHLILTFLQIDYEYKRLFKLESIQPQKQLSIWSYIQDWEFHDPFNKQVVSAISVENTHEITEGTESIDQMDTMAPIDRMQMVDTLHKLDTVHTVGIVDTLHTLDTLDTLAPVDTGDILDTLDSVSPLIQNWPQFYIEPYYSNDLSLIYEGKEAILYYATCLVEPSLNEPNILDTFAFDNLNKELDSSNENASEYDSKNECENEDEDGLDILDFILAEDDTNPNTTVFDETDEIINQVREPGKHLGIGSYAAHRYSFWSFCISIYSEVYSRYAEWSLTPIGNFILEKCIKTFISSIKVISWGRENYLVFANALDEYKGKSNLYKRYSDFLIENVNRLEEISLSWYEHIAKQDMAGMNQLIASTYAFRVPNYNRTVIIWSALTILVFSTWATYLGLAYLNIWTIVEERLDMRYRSRRSELRTLINESIFDNHFKEFKERITIPRGGPLIRIYKALYSLYINKRIVGQKLQDTQAGSDLLRLRRSIFQKSLITPRILQQSLIQAKQRLGQIDYNNRFLWDQGLSALYHMMTTYHSAPSYALTSPFTYKELAYSDLYYAMYSNHQKETYLPKGTVLSLIDSNNIRNNSSKIKYDLGPMCYPLELLPFRSYMIIGKEESGKTYLAKSIALNTNLPLVYIGLNTVFTTPKELICEVNLHNDTGMRPFLDRPLEYMSDEIAENFIKMQILFRLAERITPCVVWLPTVQRYTSDWFKNWHVRESWKLFMVSILDMTERNAYKYGKRTMIILAGCENTRYLDPIYLRPHRFHQLIRLENPSAVLREQRMLGLLETQGMQLSPDFEFTTVRNATMGYTMKDIAYLVETIHRMCINLNSKTVSPMLISEAVGRQQISLNLGHFSRFSSSWQFVAYKLGKALVKRTTFPQPLFHVNKTYWIWQFYYLSQWFLETQNTDSCITTNVMLSYFYINLAGIAAKDAWITMCHGRIEDNNAISHKAFKHDIQVAIEIFRAYYTELGYLRFSNQCNQQFKRPTRFSPEVSLTTGNLLSILGKVDVAKAHYLDTDLDLKIDYEVSRYSPEDPRQFAGIIEFTVSLMSDRIPMYRSFLYDMEQHLSHSPSIYSVSRYGLPQHVMASYRHILTDEEYWRGHEHHYQEEDTFEPTAIDVLQNTGKENKLLFNRRCKLMAWNKHIDELNWLVEHHNAGDPLCLLSSRPIWNPKPIFPIHLEFPQRYLVAHRLLMSHLYSIYIDKPEDPNQLIHIAKPFWFRDEEKEELEKKIEAKLRAARAGGEEEDREEQELQERLEQLKEKFESFDMYSQIVRPNSELLRPSLQELAPPDYKPDAIQLIRNFDVLINASPLEGLQRHNVIGDDQLYDQYKAIPLEIFMHKSLLDSYTTMYRWFIDHEEIFLKLLQTLITQGVLWPEQLDTFVEENALEAFNKIIPPEQTYDKYIRNQSMKLRPWFWRSLRPCFPGTGYPEYPGGKVPKEFEKLKVRQGKKKKKVFD